MLTGKLFKYFKFRCESACGPKYFVNLKLVKVETEKVKSKL